MNEGAKTKRPIIKVKVLREGAILPKSQTLGSVGIDLHAHCRSETNQRNTILIPPRASRNIPTGIALEMESGFWAGVFSRSGLAAQKAVFVTNGVGIVDPDYRGEIMVLLYNGGHESYWVQHEDRIAQLILFPAVFPQVTEVKELTKTLRGEAGFGSTGR